MPVRMLWKEGAGAPGAPVLILSARALGSDLEGQDVVHPHSPCACRRLQSTSVFDLVRTILLGMGFQGTREDRSKSLMFDLVRTILLGIGFQGTREDRSTSLMFNLVRRG